MERERKDSLERQVLMEGPEQEPASWEAPI